VMRCTKHPDLEMSFARCPDDHPGCLVAHFECRVCKLTERRADLRVRFSYVEFRGDSDWPYCPRCGEDELYSLAGTKGQPVTVESICGCYYCTWTPTARRMLEEAK